MANKSLTDLTARTATADSDLLHINSGGTDYKELKSDFLHGSFGISFNNTSLLTAQVDALNLPNKSGFSGIIEAWGRASETGLPVGATYYVSGYIYLDTYKVIEIWLVTDPSVRYQCSQQSGTWGSWTQLPSRAEITSLNNSLTNTSVTISAGSSSVTVTRSYSYRYGNIVFVGVRFKVTSAIAIYGYVLQIPSTMIVPTDVYAPLMSSYFTTMDGRGLYLDASTYTFRASSEIPSGDYTFYCPVLVN